MAQHCLGLPAISMLLFLLRLQQRQVLVLRSMQLVQGSLLHRQLRQTQQQLLLICCGLVAKWCGCC
jgi:hypothetical protein